MPGVEFDKRSAQRIVDTVLRVEKLPHDLRDKDTLDKRRGNPINWLLGRNNASATIPAYSCVRVETGSTIDGVYRAYLGKPSTTFIRSYGITPSVDQTDYSGLLAYHAEAGLVKYDTGTPVVDEVWGPKPGQWTISKNYPGFRILGIHNATDKIAIVVPEPILTLHGKADAKIANDSTGTFSVYIDKSTDSTINITVRVAEYAPDLFADEWATVHFHNGQWYYDESSKSIDGTLAGALAVGSSATMNVDPGSDTVTVYDAVMKTGTADIASNKKVYASWFKLRKRWQAVQAECP